MLKNIESYFLQRKWTRDMISKLLKNNDWPLKTEQRRQTKCVGTSSFDEETTISYLLKRYNKSVIKMSFSKLMKIQIFHESLILAQDERWRRA